MEQHSDLTATHAYKWPGNYKITLNVFDSNGNVYISYYSPIVNIINVVEDQLIFKDYGRFIYDVPASKIIDPLTILRRNSYQTINNLSAENFTINLYASGALGDYINLEAYNSDKWGHLRSLSRFYEKQKIGDTETLTIVNAVTTKDTKIYARINNNKLELCAEKDTGSIFVGSTGYADIYYVDDRTKNFSTRESPIFVMATQDNWNYNDKFTYSNNLFDFISYPPQGFQTLQTAVQPIIKVRHNPASLLSITTNGIDGEGFLSGTNFDLPKISWQNTGIPFLIKLKDNENFTTRTYPELSCLKIDTNNTYNALLSTFNLQLDLVQYKNGIPYRIKDVNFYSDFSKEIPRSVGSFYKGYFISPLSSLTCKLTAGMLVVDPVNFPKDSLLGWICEPNFRYVQRLFKTQMFSFCTGSQTSSITGKGQHFPTPNDLANSFCVAVAPSGAGKFNDYQTWIGDGSADVLYKLDVFGTILSSFAMSSYPVSATDTGYIYEDFRSPVLSSAALNCIVMDSKSDLWISLFDSASVFKIDYSTGVAKNYIQASFTNFCYFLSSDYTIPSLSGYVGENLLLPSCIDTDSDDNVWVTYTHPASNFIAKFNPTGSLITTIPLPPLISPVSMIVDRDKYVWVTALNNAFNPPDIRNRNDFVYKFDKQGNIAPNFPVAGVHMAGNITVDGDQNAYIAHSIETLTKIDKNSGQFTNFIAGIGTNPTNYICSIGGLTNDTSNFIWVLNNSDRKLYYFDGFLNNQPLSSVSYQSIDFPTNVVGTISSFAEARFQAYGDWNGFRWINKFMIPFTVTRYVSGESTEFDIYPDTGSYNIQKINENFNAEQMYDDLRYQEILIDRNVFFNDFLGTIVGGMTAQPYELGKTIYEKIANFASNTSDPIKCNLNSLLSFCYELGVQFEQYNYPFPPQLRRLVDMLSIKHKALFGDKNTFNTSFNKMHTVNPNIGRNLGSTISPISGKIICGQPIVALELFSNLYSLINNKQIPGVSFGTVLSLSSYNYNWAWGLVAPKSLTGSEIGTYYKFYTYLDKQEGTFYNNTIDWKNSMNLLSPYISSYNQWSQDNGMMQNMLSYELTKGLKLFTSAADIQYNN